MNANKSADQVAQDDIDQAFTEVVEQVRKNTAMLEQMIKMLQDLNDQHDETLAGLETLAEGFDKLNATTETVRTTVSEMADEAYRNRRKVA